MNYLIHNYKLTKAFKDEERGNKNKYDPYEYYVKVRNSTNKGRMTDISFN